MGTILVVFSENKILLPLFSIWIRTLAISQAFVYTIMGYIPQSMQSCIHGYENKSTANVVLPKNNTRYIFDGGRPSLTRYY